MDRFPLDLSLLHAHPALSQKVQDSVNLITETLRRWNPTEVGFSFNGGKDSVVLAALVLHVATKLELEKHAKAHEGRCRVGDIRTIFFLTEKEYPEMLGFMRDFASTFHLRVIELTCGIKEGLSKLVGEDGSMPDIPIQAMFMGTRRDDPHGKFLTGFSPTDSSWPSLMRVNPILEFQYHDIWNLIQIFQLPYCKLYNQGYTSIGATDDTTTNETLWNPALQRYAKPWMLSCGSFERLGRGCRNFLTKRGFSSFLDYPPAVLSHITKWIPFKDIANLFLCGNQSLNRDMTQFSVTSISSSYKVSNDHTQPPPHYYALLQQFSGIKELKLSISWHTDQISKKSLLSFHDSLPSLRLPLNSLQLDYFVPPVDEDMLQETLFHLVEPSKLSKLIIRSNQKAPQLAVEPSVRYLSLHGPEVGPGALKQFLHLEHLSLPLIDSKSDLLASIYRMPSLKSLEIVKFLCDTSSATDELLSLLQSSSLTRLESQEVSDESIFSVLPHKMTSLNLGIKVIKAPFSLPPTLCRLVLRLASVCDTNTMEAQESKHLTADPSEEAHHKMFPRFNLLALPNTLQMLEIRSPGAFCLPPAPGPWPEGLEQLEVDLNLDDLQALESMPNTLKQVDIGSHHLFAKNWPEIMRLLPKKIVSLTLPLPLVPARVSLLPPTLTSLVIQNDQSYSDFPQGTTPNGEIIKLVSEAVARLPRGLKSLSTTEPAAKHLIPLLPSSLERLDLKNDQSLDGSDMALLPRSLDFLNMEANSSIFDQQLTKLPPCLSTFIAPNIDCQFSLEILALILPPSLTRFQVRSLSFELN